MEWKKTKQINIEVRGTTIDSTAMRVGLAGTHRGSCGAGPPRCVLAQVQTPAAGC